MVSIGGEGCAEMSTPFMHVKMTFGQPDSTSVLYSIQFYQNSARSNSVRVNCPYNVSMQRHHVAARTTSKSLPQALYQIADRQQVAGDQGAAPQLRLQMYGMPITLSTLVFGGLHYGNYIK